MKYPEIPGSNLGMYSQKDIEKKIIFFGLPLTCPWPLCKVAGASSTVNCCRFISHVCCACGTPSLTTLSCEAGAFTMWFMPPGHTVLEL